MCLNLFRSLKLMLVCFINMHVFSKVSESCTAIFFLRLSLTYCFRNLNTSGGLPYLARLSKFDNESLNRIHVFISTVCQYENDLQSWYVNNGLN